MMSSFLAPIPDEPPLVEITEPAKDLQLPADASLLVEVFASDDHGVAGRQDQCFHAGEKEEETLFVEPIEKEKKLSYILDLNDRALAVGGRDYLHGFGHGQQGTRGAVGPVGNLLYRDSSA